MLNDGRIPASSVFRSFESCRCFGRSLFISPSPSASPNPPLAEPGNPERRRSLHSAALILHTRFVDAWILHSNRTPRRQIPSAISTALFDQRGNCHPPPTAIPDRYVRPDHTFPARLFSLQRVPFSAVHTIVGAVRAVVGTGETARIHCPASAANTLVCVEVRQMIGLRGNLGESDETAAAG